jgi:hypothetical protein
MATDLESLSHEDLWRMRDQPGADQQALAPLEHQAFAREYAAENPVRALGLVAGIPAYQAAKGVGLMGSRTGVSQAGAQMAAGYKGLGQGWGMALRRFMESIIPSAEAAEVPPQVVQTRNPDGTTSYRKVAPVTPAAPAQVTPPVPAAPPRTFESDYERELRFLRGGRNSVGGASILRR